MDLTSGGVAVRATLPMSTSLMRLTKYVLSSPPQRRGQLAPGPLTGNGNTSIPIMMALTGGALTGGALTGGALNM